MSSEPDVSTVLRGLQTHSDELGGLIHEIRGGSGEGDPDPLDVRRLDSLETELTEVQTHIANLIRALDKSAGPVKEVDASPSTGKQVKTFCGFPLSEGSPCCLL